MVVVVLLLLLLLPCYFLLPAVNTGGGGDVNEHLPAAPFLLPPSYHIPLAGVTTSAAVVEDILDFFYTYYYYTFSRVHLRLPVCSGGDLMHTAPAYSLLVIFNTYHTIFNEPSLPMSIPTTCCSSLAD